MFHKYMKLVGYNKAQRGIKVGEDKIMPSLTSESIAKPSGKKVTRWVVKSFIGGKEYRYEYKSEAEAMAKRDILADYEEKFYKDGQDKQDGFGRRSNVNKPMKTTIIDNQTEGVDTMKPTNKTKKVTKTKKAIEKKASAPKGKKICSRCKDPLLLKCFSNNKARKDGLHGHCRECESAYQKSRRGSTTKAVKKVAKKSTTKKNVKKSAKSTKAKVKMVAKKATTKKTSKRK